MITPDKIKNLEQEKKSLEDANVVVRYNKEALQEEKSLILSNKSIGGANTGVNWEQLENIADFYRERLVDISQKWTELDKTEKENNKKYRLICAVPILFRFFLLVLGCSYFLYLIFLNFSC